MFLCSIGGSVMQFEPLTERAPQLFAVLARLFPGGHHLALWHPSPLQSGGAMLGLVGIGLGFFGLGFWRFSRRDA
jgi:hypothetical protein